MFRTATALVCVLAAVEAIAVNPADSLKLLLPLSKSDTDKVWLLRDIAYYMRPDHPDSALHYSRRGAALARTLNFPEGEVRNLYQAALAFERKEQADSAFATYRRAVEISERSGAGKALTDMLNALGSARYYAGDLTEAVRCYSRAFAAADSLNLYEAKSYALNNMGVVYRLQGRYDEALKVYRKSLEIKEARGDTAGAVNALYNMGLALSFGERHEESLEALSRARELADFRQNREDDIANIEVGIGVACYNLGMFDRARGHLITGLEGLDHADPHTHAAGLACLGALNVREGRRETGMKQIEEAYAYAKKSGRLELLLQIAGERASAAEAIGDHALEAESRRVYSLLADSLRSRDMRRLREELQARFELKEKEITIAGQQWQIERELLRNRRMLTTAILFLLLAIGCGVMAFLLKRRAVQLNLAVAEKEKALEENELLLREMHHRTKNNLQLLHSVFNLHRRATENEDAREVLKAGKESVEAIGLLHRHLYRSGDFRRVNMRPFLVDLVAFFTSAFSLEERGIDFRLSCPDLEVDIDVAVPLGIVINELSTNALKYAFDAANDPRIELKITTRDKRLSICLSDNGDGGAGETRTLGTGSRLVDLFGKKLGAEITRRADESGTLVQMEFEIPEKP